MENTNEITKLSELSTWDMRDTVRKYSSLKRDDVEMPEATANNMFLLMEKINELVNTVNELKECLIIAKR